MATSVDRGSTRTRRRSKRRRFTVLIANDGSPQAQAAVRAAVDFPWPAGAVALGLVAWGGPRWAARVSTEVKLGAQRIAHETGRLLRRRWPKAIVELADEPPIEAILRRTSRTGAIVVGAHGYSRLQRWILGSVSRTVVRRAASAVLVVRGRRPAPRHFVIGYDGSSNARRAIGFVAKLKMPRNGRVILVGLSEPIRSPATAFMPSSLRAALASEVRSVNAKRLARTQRQLEGSARPLKAAGWRVRTEARHGIAVRDLGHVAAALSGDLLVVGARGASGLRRILLGSVADAVLDRASMPVLVVR
jgi:nucleotide-binding universal stress UspA family protein